MTAEINNRGRVAIVGAGPGGLVTAKYLKEQGFEPVLFEQSDSIGGQWNIGAPHSAVWRGMRTNSSRVMTAFSDLPNDAVTSVYPTGEEMLEYLRRYAVHFGLNEHVRRRTRIKLIEQNADCDGWLVHYTSGVFADDEETYIETFDRVVVASGRFNKPSIPHISGLGTFSGLGGAMHSFAYNGAEVFRGLRRVLVAGCSISALEIVSELAQRLGGDARVVSAQRRQRYIFPKLLAGVPTDHVVFNRFASLAGASYPMQATADNFKKFVVGTSGNPEQFGAPRPSENLFEAGIAQSQYYLPMVAEGRIVTKPWIREIEGQTVHFMDGTAETMDALIFATGYKLNLPFLSDDIKQKLNVDDNNLDLHGLTFHPDLPGLAFVGLVAVIGPNFPTMELQARWIAYTWGGVRPAPSRQIMEAGIARSQAARNAPLPPLMHSVAVQLAKEIGVEPALEDWPELSRALLFGPLSPASFRLTGPGCLSNAAERFAADASAFGAIRSPELSPPQRDQLAALAAVCSDAALKSFALNTATTS